MTIALGGDHAGYHLKEMIKKRLDDRGIDVIDHGPHGDQSVDYPDFVHPVCHDILDGTATLGILICGSGNGVAITANKYKGIRCGLCWTSELATLTKQHNDANAIALPARFISESAALEIVDSYLDSSFEGGRHQRRVDKIDPKVAYLC
jgi:ribose 5-phosphate isomerase B